jgi:hypothetical protein
VSTTLGLGLDVTSEARELLIAVERHFSAAGNALPDRRGLVPGDPRSFAWDCEQVTVSLAGIGWGPAAAAGPPSPRTGSPASVMTMRHAVLLVTLVRCTPQMTDSGEPPPADQLDTAGGEFMRDAGLLSQAIAAYVADASSRLDRVATVEAGVVEPLGPSAEFHGLEASLAITVGKLI